ncbi:protein kinase domain-containing protein [Ditylenchus destructor]|nr:protein kinase domain-containing protein [Ditylenchus destructor]
MSGVNLRSENELAVFEYIKELRDNRANEHLIELYDSAKTPTTVYLVLEAGLMTLKDFMDKHPQLLCQNVPGLWNEFVGNVNYLHSIGLRHRDIKPGNLVLTDKNRLKLIDFNDSELSAPSNNFSRWTPYEKITVKT